MKARLRITDDFDLCQKKLSDNVDSLISWDQKATISMPKYPQKSQNGIDLTWKSVEMHFEKIKRQKWIVL